ncbi:hypothetical protein EVAR_4084_1 [Eumeta japonica]|uniref:Uncharacterized protein n=1 Tax=Eumeta variegata TaxID=151549 RepID=A0A4C1T3Z5_EUMVA|nr:hypothetical protein EVAR_4084_1 [Eumeta japonica]
MQPRPTSVHQTGRIQVALPARKRAVHYQIAGHAPSPRSTLQRRNSRRAPGGPESRVGALVTSHSRWRLSCELRRRSGRDRWGAVWRRHAPLPVTLSLRLRASPSTKTIVRHRARV